MENQGIRPVNIEQEMQQSYLDYAMSVIISRALPDARDGLKPVQRRILYAMYDMGIRPDSTYKKSARIVGEVLGKYHPHGDSAVYDAMARLAQDFSIRYPLVEGQGNFGSIDGDPPAAMRYTEAKLDKFSMELLDHIDQDTVDFMRNFDDTLDEPVVLPSIVPNLLVNGASGIAVGMATNIPPHNLAEVVDALTFMLQSWEQFDDISVEDLMRFVKGPEFPTGGIVVLEDARNELVAAYATGRGRLTVRGRVHLEEMGRGRSRLIINEIPYQVNKNGLIERIAQLVRDNVLEGITDLRDESDRQGMRIVIELSKAGDAEDVLRKLYKHTPLQTTFGIILLALVDGGPRVLNLKQALRVYVDHQLEVIRRQTQFELNKAERRAHIIQGLLVAIRNLDEIIAIIRDADDEKAARATMTARFNLDTEQAQAILDMPLKRLTKMESGKLESEFAALQHAIAEMKDLLATPAKMRAHLSDELADLKKRFTDPRRTQIALLGEGISSKEVLTANALVAADEMFVGLTSEGKIGRCDPALLREKGFVFPRWLIAADTQQTVYFVSETGNTFGIYVETLPKVESFSDGIDFSALSGWEGGTPIAAAFGLSPDARNSDTTGVITVTENGLVKKTMAAELPFASSQGFALCKVNAGDRLLTVLVSLDDSYELMLASKKGMAIRFDQQDLRAMGLVAAGVNGMKLKADDSLTAALMVTERDKVCFVSSGWGLRTIPVSEFPKQGRYGQGVIAVRLSQGESIVAALIPGEGKPLFLLHYGKGKSQRVRPTTLRAVKRARGLEYTLKMLDQPVRRASIIPDTAAGAVASEPGPKEKVKTDPVPEPQDPTSGSSEGGEQYTLF